jgi:1,2-diacylglycerol 3-alpha-glucosyltransferase
MMILAPFILDKIGSLKSDIKCFDVINTHHYPANYIIRNLEGPLKIVTEWSAVTPTMFSSIREKLYIRWARYANRVAAQNADIVLAPCDFVNKWIRQNYSINAITMFLDGINFQIFDRSRVTPEKFFQLYPSIEGKEIVLYVGRIAESKNIHSLIKAFALIKKRLPDTILVLVGDYQNYLNYYKKLKELVKTESLENDVIFTGIVPWEYLPSFYAACNIYATCSLWEGFLRAEAYAFGKPIIAFNTGANSETVKDGKTGFLIDNYNIDEFADKMYKLLTDKELARELGENGYRWAKENLDFDLITNRFELLCLDKIYDSYRSTRS